MRHRQLALPLLALCAVALAPWALAFDSTRRVAITIDDLPGRRDLGAREIHEMTEAILGALAAHRAPVTGFVIGGRVAVERQEDHRLRLLDRWIEAGAELGNHTFSHASLNVTKLEDYLQDIARAEALLPSTGGRPRFFRAPQNQIGATEEAKRGLAKYLSDNGYRSTPFTIEHSDDLFDAAYVAALAAGDGERAAEIGSAYLDDLDTAFDFFESLSQEMFGRDIAQVFLIHANPLNAASLDRMLLKLEARGYAFVSLRTALEDRVYETPDVYVGPAGISWLHRWSLSKGYGERRTKSGLKFPETLFREPDPPGFVLGR